jgi:hypothetical protein
MVSALFCAESAAPENAMAQIKIFSSLYCFNFTLAKVWQEIENDFSEKPINWSDLPKLLCW